MSPTSFAAAATGTDAVLDLFVGDRPGPSYPLSTDRPNTIGRSSDADITIADRLVSRLHATIRPDPSGWTIADLGSRNGTRLDGVTITEATLQPGAVIGIGTHSLLFRSPRARAVLAAPNGWRVRFVTPLAELVGSALGAQTGPAEQMTRFLAATRLLGCHGSGDVATTVVELVVANCAVAGAAWLPAAATTESVAAEPAGEVLTGLIEGALRQAIVSCGSVVCLSPERPTASDGGVGDLVCVPVGPGPDGLLAIRATESPLRSSDLDFLAVVASLAAARHDTGPTGAGPADKAAFVAACPDLEITAWERVLIGEAIRRHGGNVGAAARALGLSRATLYRRLGSGRQG